MALTQLGIAKTIVSSAFIITLSGLALAFGLAFGLGGRDFASKNLRKLDNTIDETSVKETEPEETGLNFNKKKEDTKNQKNLCKEKEQKQTDLILMKTI